MQKHTGNVTDQAGNVLSGVQVTVRLASSGALATIYSDNDTQVMANPFTNESDDGSYFFYAANGRYNLEFSRNGFSFDALDEADVILFDPVDGFTTTGVGGINIAVTNPTLSISVPTFAWPATAAGPFTASILTTWQTGAAEKAGALIVQTVVEGTAPALGSAGAIHGGLLNKLNGTDGYGILGMVNNDATVATPTGAAIWGLARGTPSSTGSVDGIRASSEYDNAVHPRAGLYVAATTNDNLWESGVWIETALTYGLRIGGGGANPTHPIHYLKYAAGPTFTTAFEVGQNGAVATDNEGEGGGYAVFDSGRTARFVLTVANTGVGENMTRLRAASAAGLLIEDNAAAELLRIVSTGLTAVGIVAGAQLKTTTPLITATNGSAIALFTLNMIGSTGGPATAAQNGWLKMLDSAGATIWVPVWK